MFIGLINFYVLIERQRRRSLGSGGQLGSHDHGCGLNHLHRQRWNRLSSSHTFSKCWAEKEVATSPLCICAKILVISNWMFTKEMLK